MSLTNDQKKQYRAIAHNLNPIVMVGDKGLSEGLMQELERALTDHELIKIKLAIGDRDIRQQVIEQLCQDTGSTLVQVIGKMAIILRRNPKANPRLSNLMRN